MCTEDLYTRTCLLRLSYHQSIASLDLVKTRMMRMIRPDFELGNPVDPQYVSNYQDRQGS